ncbi:sensor histidine kinase [Nitrogeniibacter mangrovi]|uniref:Sensor histidine kinase n=1 Tax=Nitrogeniibacter mangrovi TaxID=2016596 RepID=A0A6C1B1K1_9RHOO|nr:sensor histidine kinase [Nitrogeniibacter mangrovi]QID17492.1 sensor histidine kinase [Nitrogeniibacter mangrovi]
MDLRRRLTLTLAAFFLVLVGAAIAWAGVALRADVAHELEASERLVGLMRAAVSGDEALVARLADGHFRHIRVALDRASLEQPLQIGAADWSERLADRLARSESRAAPIERIAVGPQVLYVRPDPRSEIGEIVRDAGQWVLTVLAFSLLTMATVWFAVGRALAPVRLLEARITALDDPEARGTKGPHFALREFRVLARAIDRLAAKLAAARSAQRTLSQCLISVQETERRDIARELHDEFGQSLTAIGLSAAFVQRHAGRARPAELSDAASDICHQADHLGQHLRGLLSRLRPHGLDGVGLVDTVRDCVRSWQTRTTGVEVRLDLPGHLPPIESASALCVYRGVQEALTNVARHSGATRVTIGLRCAAGCLELRVMDNGHGLADPRDANVGIGLLGMRERAAMAGGTLTTENSEAGGLVLVLRLPLQPTQRGVTHDSNPVA